MLGTLGLALTSGYLAVASTPGWTHALALVLHPLLGLAVAGMAWRAWRQGAGTTPLILFGLSLLAAVAALLTAAGAGGLWIAHALLGLGGLAVLAFARGGDRLAVSTLAALFVGIGLGALARASISPQAFANPPAPARFADEALAGEDGPFFPSAARSASGAPLAASDLDAADRCAECHPREVAEWRSSPHRWSGVADPWYRQALEDVRRERGPAAARWCAGCHDPALLLSGTADGAPSELAASPAADAGVGCTLCHGISSAGSSMGQAHYTVELPSAARAATAGGWRAGVEALLLRLDPERHRRTWSRPALSGDRAAELCSTCHKGHVGGLLSGGRHLEMVNDFDSWQAASVSGRGARSFYWPEPRDCAGCHLPPRAGGGLSHRFAAADTTAALLSGDADQMAAVEAALGGGAVTVDLFAVSAAPAGDGAPPELRAAPLDRVEGAVLRGGESVRIDAVIRVREVGHLFPGGKNDGVDCWLELTVEDGDGTVVLSSGAGEAGEAVDPAAHFLRRRRIGDEGSPVELRDIWQARGDLSNQTIQPNTADVVRYRLEVPPRAGELRLRARLRYRQHGWEFDRHVRRNTEAELPELPVLTVAEDSLTLAVLPAGGEVAPSPAPAAGDRDRFNDYGIGLLLQGDLRGARAAFTAVTEADPGWADGWLNLARVATNEGDVEAVGRALGRAEELAPDLARVRYYRGRLEQSLGNLEAAREHLRAVADEYPADRLVRFQLGNLLELLDDLEGAAAEFEAFLDVDPESAAAHLNLGRIYRALGDGERADRHQRLAERFRRDEEGQALARAYLESNPDENRERQAIHEHRSAPPAAATPGSGS